MDRAPDSLGRTPRGAGARVRYELGAQPLSALPMPSDTATWPDPTSRTGLRINASLVAAAALDRAMMQRLSALEGWGTFAPITVAFDADERAARDRVDADPVLDLPNIEARHRGDDYDFANDAVYVINLETGVPVALDLGTGSFSYTSPRLDALENDPRHAEPSLLWETIDESLGGALTRQTFAAENDTDLDGTLDTPNLDDPRACPGPDPMCDLPGSADEESPECAEKRRERDRCIADHLLTWYERETETLILRPLLPLDEMTRYAVVITDRTVDRAGNAVRSPFEDVYPASMRPQAARVMDVLNDSALKSYFGDLHGTGLAHVAFTWSFTTQPTVSDMKTLRDGLFGEGPFARWEHEHAPAIELHRTVGLEKGLAAGAKDAPGWATSTEGAQAGCPEMKGNLYAIRYEPMRSRMQDVIAARFDVPSGPRMEQLLRSLDNIDHVVTGSFASPHLLSDDPSSAEEDVFELNFKAGSGKASRGELQFLLAIPKETARSKQPFDVVVYSHAYNGDFTELMLYAGDMARHGLATIGINAVGHGLAFRDARRARAAEEALAARCAAPLYDALHRGRARDLDGDGLAEPGGELLSSYVFHARDGIRQSVLDQIQLVRVLRSLGERGATQTSFVCKNETTGWDAPATEPCDVDGDGEPEIAGDFDANGVADLGGPSAHYSVLGVSPVGGVVAAIQGAIDPHVSAVVPAGSAGGLTDAMLRSEDEAIASATVLRAIGPLLVSIPASERPRCRQAPAGDSGGSDRCTVCAEGEASLRWIAPDARGAGEVEIRCLTPGDLRGTTVFVENRTSGELRCARVDDALRFRVSLPASLGDRVAASFYDGVDAVKSYASCAPSIPVGTLPRLVVDAWGRGRIAGADSACASASCARFRGRTYGEGSPLTAPADGFGLARQTPAFRRFMALAQTALDPADPMSFAPLYLRRPLVAPGGAKATRRGILSLGAAGDTHAPSGAGIAFARALGALPFLRPDQAEKYTAYADFVTPEELFASLGERTPNQELIDAHVVEGIASHARHPAGAACAASANAKPRDATFATAGGAALACFPDGCTAETEAAPATRRCYAGARCDLAQGRCVPEALGVARCEEALFDVDDLDEGSARTDEQNATTPHRLARYAEPADPAMPVEVWEPRLDGAPGSADLSWQPEPERPLAALLNAYAAPEGAAALSGGSPCQGFDVSAYLMNLIARFMTSKGTELYYLSHPETHHCLADADTCSYLNP